MLIFDQEKINLFGVKEWSKSADRYKTVYRKDILFLYHNNKYTEVHSLSMYVDTTVSLKTFIGLMPELIFVHRNTVVRKDSILKLEKRGKEFFVHLKGTDRTFEVSRRNLSKIRKLLKKKQNLCFS